jgi:hypothetical protein
MLLFTNQEAEYQRKQFDETLMVHGIDAYICPVKRTGGDEVYDFYNDIQSDRLSFGKPIKVKIVFQEVPQMRTLKALGWFVNDENLPYLAYLPVKYISEYGQKELLTPIVDDKIAIIENTVDGNRSVREYLIKDFKSQGFPNTIYHVCKLVPYRSNTSLELDYPEDTESGDA